jgi:hypothetical protein
MCHVRTWTPWLRTLKRDRRWLVRGPGSQEPTRHLCRQAEARQRSLAGLLDEKHNQAGISITTRITACSLPVFLAVSCESLAQE